MNTKQLIEVLVKICVYAQDHSGDISAWGPRNSDYLHEAMEHTSYVVACFLAQNTRGGNDGVSFDIVLDKLAGPVLSERQWTRVITDLVNTLEGSHERI
jgi:hypothetical protein